MHKLRFIVQFSIRFFMFFLLSFIWLRFLIKPIILTIVISTLTALFFEFSLNIIYLKKNNNKKLKLKEKEDAENMFLSLSITNKFVDFFNKLASTRHNTEKKLNYIVVKHKDYNVILYPFIFFKTLEPDDINKIILDLKNENYKKLVICCNESSKNTDKHIKNFEFEIVILDKYETYLSLYKFYNYFPEITLSYKPIKKEGFKDLLALSFNRSRTKGYLFSAIVLLFSSFFIKFNLYYSIFSSLLIIFAFISLFNPFKKAQKNFEL